MQCHSLFKNKHQGYYWEYMPSSVLLLQPFWLVLKSSVGDVHVKCYGTLHQMCFSELLWVCKIKCTFSRHIYDNELVVYACKCCMKHIKRYTMLGLIYSMLFGIRDLYILEVGGAIRSVRKAALSPWFKFTHSSAQWELTATSETIWWRHLWGEPID